MMTSFMSRFPVPADEPERRLHMQRIRLAELTQVNRALGLGLGLG